MMQELPFDIEPWTVRYLFCRGDTYLAFGIGIVTMILTSRICPISERKKVILELVFAYAWLVTIPLWLGFAYADTISIVFAMYLAIAFGFAFALSALRCATKKSEKLFAAVPFTFAGLFIGFNTVHVVGKILEKIS